MDAMSEHCHLCLEPCDSELRLYDKDSEEPTEFFYIIYKCLQLSIIDMHVNSVLCQNCLNLINDFLALRTTIKDRYKEFYCDVRSENNDAKKEKVIEGDDISFVTEDEFQDIDIEEFENQIATNKENEPINQSPITNKTSRTKKKKQNTAKRKSLCTECGLTLSSTFSLKRHKITKHSKATTINKCDECNKVYKDEEALRRHKYFVHNLKKLFQCSKCDRSFKVSQALKDHMSAHIGKSFQCMYCSRTFNIRANMYRHRKKMHFKEWSENLKRKN